MNIICFTGVHMYLYNAYKYRSFRCMIIYLNGILYHGTSNNILRYNDILFNLCILFFTTYKYKSSRLYALLGTLIYILNDKYKNKLNKRTNDLIHVFGVQGILLKGLIESIKEKSI